MPESDKCPKCGAPVRNNAPAGICPKCLMEAGLNVDNDPIDSGANTLEPTSDLRSTGNSDGDVVVKSVSELAPLFPNLELHQILGHGGMGAVYKARHVKLDRDVALKIIRPDVLGTQCFAERFEREAQALAKLNHPNIVGVYDFGSVEQTGCESEGELYFLLMEYVDGVNLRQLIASDSLDPDQSLAIVPQICDALQFAHDAGVVHRDIKPENILLDKSGRVKIADFGLAKIANDDSSSFDLTGTHQVMGTPRYMAPEQLEQTCSVDHRADIYSLGVVFYEMLTGELPIGQFEVPSRKISVDVRLDEIVLKSLAKEPERRYQLASEFKTDVDSISESDFGIEKSTEAIDSAKKVSRLGRFRLRWLVLLPLVIVIGLYVQSLVTGWPKFEKEPIQQGHRSQIDALMGAAANGDLSGVMEMLDTGISVNDKDASGKTALMVAAANGHSTLCQTLMVMGANAVETDGLGKTALMHAAEAGHSHVIDAIFDVNGIGGEWVRKLDLDWELLKDLDLEGRRTFGGSAAPDAQDENGETALMKAAKNGDADSLRVLTHRSDEALRDNKGQTALTHAILNHKATLIREASEGYSQFLIQIRWEDTWYSTTVPLSGQGLSRLVGLDVLRLVDENGITALQHAGDENLMEIHELLHRQIDTIINKSTEMIEAGKNLKFMYQIRGAAFEALGDKIKAEADFQKAMM